MNKVFGAFAVSAVAGLINAQVASAADVKCSGINTCKGTSDCKTATSACKSQNTCKGQGWTHAKDKAECESKGGKVVADDGAKKAKGKKKS